MTEDVVFQLVVVTVAILLAAAYLVRRAVRAARRRDACDCGCSPPATRSSAASRPGAGAA